jgi:hypothetical protein
MEKIYNQFEDPDVLRGCTMLIGKLLSLTQENSFDMHTAWVESLNPRDDLRVKKYRSFQKHESLSLHDLRCTGRHL